MAPPNLGKSTGVWIARNQEELLDSLPEPGRTWKWSQTDLSHKCLSQMQQRELIVQINGEWRTTRRLWEALAEYADQEEAMGDTTGQESLDADLAHRTEAVDQTTDRGLNQSRDSTRQALLDRFLEGSDTDSHGWGGIAVAPRRLLSQHAGGGVDE